MSCSFHFPRLGVGSCASNRRFAGTDWDCENFEAMTKAARIKNRRVCIIRILFANLRRRLRCVQSVHEISKLGSGDHRLKFGKCVVLFSSFLLCAFFLPAAQAQIDDATKNLSHDIFKQLIEINTTDSVGNVTTAAEAMAQRFRDTGFVDSDMQVLGPNDRKKNLVVRFHGTGKHKPLLLIGHLDVVEAKREDWTTDPFTFVEKDGFYYGRGTQDMKSADAILVTTLIRFKKERFTPDRDIILALTADEE